MKSCVHTFNIKNSVVLNCMKKQQQLIGNKKNKIKRSKNKQKMFKK